MKLTRRVLHNKAKPWVFVGCDFQTKQLATQMQDFMRLEKGIGLAATQVGISRRVFVMEIDGRQWNCFNPEILERSTDLLEYTEGCLSFPGEECKIKRPTAVTVRYQTVSGDWVTEDLDGLAARCFQHELDHLDGITMHDRAKEQHATES